MNLTCRETTKDEDGLSGEAVLPPLYSRWNFTPPHPVLRSLVRVSTSSGVAGMWNLSGFIPPNKFCMVTVMTNNMSLYCENNCLWKEGPQPPLSHRDREVRNIFYCTQNISDHHAPPSAALFHTGHDSASASNVLCSVIASSNTISKTICTTCLPLGTPSCGLIYSRIPPANHIHKVWG